MARCSGLILCCPHSSLKSRPFSQEPWFLSEGRTLGTKVGCRGDRHLCSRQTRTHAHPHTCVCRPHADRHAHTQGDARRCTLEKSRIHTCPSTGPAAFHTAAPPEGARPLPGTPQGILRGAASISQQREKPRLKAPRFVLAVRPLPPRPRRDLSAPLSSSHAGQHTTCAVCTWLFSFNNRS